MKIFSRLKLLIKGFIETVLQKNEDTHYKSLIEGTIAEQREKMVKIKSSMVNLVFQKRRLEEKKTTIERQLKQYEFSLERCAKDGQDKLALKIIAKTESLKEDLKFLSEQLKKMVRDISEAKLIETELEKKMEHAHNQLNIIGSKIEALRLRKGLQEDLATVSNSIQDWNSNTNISKLKDTALRLEVEMEHLEQSQNMDSEIEKIEHQSEIKNHLEILDQLKIKLKIQKNVVPEIANSIIKKEFVCVT